MLNWNNIDTVLLDMDGTLLDLHFDSYFWLDHLPQRYATSNRVDVATAKHELTEKIMAERGNLNWYCTDYWSQQLDLDIIALKKEVNDKISWRPFAKEFLTAINNSHRTNLLVTNAHRDVLNIKRGQIGIDSFFDAMICSHDYGYPKEEIEFWLDLLQHHPFDPARTLFIDDTESVLDAARNFGIGHLLAVSQPDSQQAPRTNLHYPSFNTFDEIMPPMNINTIVSHER